MSSPDVRSALDHDLEEIWAFLEQRGVLRILVDSGSIRLLMENGNMVEGTLKGLDAVLVQDRARLREEYKVAGGVRRFLGVRAFIVSSIDDPIIQPAHPALRYGVVGRDQKRIDEINAEWRALHAWKLDIHKVLNFVLAGVVDLPSTFRSASDQARSDNARKAAELVKAKKTADAISWCVRTYNERKAKHQPISQSGIAGEAMHEFFPDIPEFAGHLGKTRKPVKNNEWLLKRDSIRKSYLQKLRTRRRKK